MDAFYASIEQRDRPDLRGRPVIVGAHPGGRGVVAAASYEARRFGVHSALPISRAARLCPHAAFVPVDMPKYARVSEQVMEVLATFSPLVEAISVDEAFVDLTGTGSLWGPPEHAVREMKRRIHEATGLTASAGLAGNKFVAKVASDLGKPDGLVVVPPGREAEFLAPLAVARLWGVGKVTARALESMGVTTIGRLQHLPVPALVARLGAHGADLHELAFGRDERAVEPWAPAKSMGAETTFERDCRARPRLDATLRAHAERVARALRAEGIAAARVTLKVRFADFRTITRAISAEPTQDGLTLYRRARALLDREEPLPQSVRLLGLAASSFVPSGTGQLDILDPSAVRRERLARAVDAITGRFGRAAILPASLVADRRGGREAR